MAKSRRGEWTSKGMMTSKGKARQRSFTTIRLVLRRQSGRRLLLSAMSGLSIRRVGSGRGAAMIATTKSGKNTPHVRATRPPRECPTKTEGRRTTSWRNPLSCRAQRRLSSAKESGWLDAPNPIRSIPYTFQPAAASVGALRRQCPQPAANPWTRTRGGCVGSPSWRQWQIRPFQFHSWCAPQSISSMNGSVTGVTPVRTTTF